MSIIIDVREAGINCFFFSTENEVNKIMSKRHDNTSRASEFICLRCLSKNQVGDKIRRPNMREKDHVKNLCCLCTKLQMRTKNLEVRWCDDFDERMEYAKKIKSKYYDENNELLPEWKTENMYVGKVVD